MKNHYIVTAIIFFLFMTSANTYVFGQGDDPCSATALTVGTTCASINVNNTGATNSVVPDATCDGGTSDGDVWFTALVGANGTIIVKLSPGTLTDVGMAIYTGTSCSSLTFNSCTAGGNPGSPNMPMKSLSGLTPGSEIWIRVWDVNNDDVGTFNICSYVNCSASVTITGSATGCSANLTQLCATAGFTSYSWNGGSTLSCINVNSTGTYTVTATDADGCTATDSQSFTALTSPTVSITGPASDCSANAPQLCVPSGFTSYNWSNGGTVRCISPATSGSYTATVTSANGCTGSDTKSITIYTSPSISIVGPPSKCSNGVEQLCAPSGYSSYSWSNGGTNQCISPINSTIYTVTVTDANNCTASASQAITIHPSPTVTITGPATACPGTNPQFCVASGLSAYLWSNGGTTNCISPPGTGNYSVTVTDGFGCTGTSSKALTIYSAASVTITGPSSACVGSSPQLCTPLGFSSYNWSNGETTECATPNATGTYTVIVTDANGCTASDNLLFTLNTLPSSTITGPTSSCNGASVQLCAPAGNTGYLWSNTNTNSCITTGTSGTYSVTVTGANGCTSSSSQTLTVFPPYAMTISGPTTACSGSNPQLCASSGSYTYQWSNGDSSACIHPSVSGTYTVVSTSLNGCTRAASKGLTVYSPLNASITGPSSACIGSIIPLCGPAGASSYTWSTGQLTDCINVNSNGIYTVIISDVNGCTASASQSVSFASTFNIDITGPISGCNGSSAQLCAPSGYSDYTWNTGGTTNCISVSSAGNYSVTVHDPVGCVANNNIDISFNSPPIVDITGSTIICKGSLAFWCATPGYENYLWSNGGTSQCVNVSRDTIYSVQVTDTNGCTSTVSSSLTVVQISPSIFESGGFLICDTVNPAYTYSWFINGSPTNCTGDSCTPSFTGLYSVIVTDTVSGCSETVTYDYINVGISIVEKDIDISLYPNPFNGNEFQIDFKNMSDQKINVSIVDVVGRLVFNDDIRVTSEKFTQTISLDSGAPGLYYVSLRTKTGIIVRKMVRS